MDPIEGDLAQLRNVWRRRRAAAENVRSRTDPRGMTRPVRSPEERDWLRIQGEVDAFVEVERDIRDTSAG